MQNKIKIKLHTIRELHEVLKEQIDILIAQVEELDAKLSKTEGVFTHFPIYNSTPLPYIPPQCTSKCPKCSISLDGVMGYCCPYHDCPTGFGRTVSSSSSCY